MRMLALVGLGLAATALAQAPSAPSYSEPVRFQALQDRIGGTWLARWCAATGTPMQVYGTGMPLPDWRENTLAEARRHALAALDRFGDLLGLSLPGLATCEFRESIGARMGRAWSFTFDQYWRGVPVVGGRAD